MIDLNIVGITGETYQVATAYLSEDGDGVTFMNGHGDIVLTVRRLIDEDGETPVLAVEASGGRFVRRGGFEVLL